MILRFIKQSKLNRFFVGFLISFIGIIILFYVAAVLWTFAIKPVIAKNYPIEAVHVETPVPIRQLINNPNYEFKTGERVTLLLTIRRKIISAPIVSLRIYCSNGYVKTIFDSVQTAPSSRSLDNEPVNLPPLEEGAGGICSYSFESKQNFIFLGQSRTQDASYGTVSFKVEE